MVFLLDMRKEDGRHTDLQAKIRQAAAGDGFEDYCSVAHLHGRLCRALAEPALIVFRPATARDLNDFLLISDLPADIRVILILPDRRLATVGLGHVLHPRYVSYDDKEFDDVAAVVQKISSRDLA